MKLRLMQRRISFHDPVCNPLLCTNPFHHHKKGDGRNRTDSKENSLSNVSSDNDKDLGPSAQYHALLMDRADQLTDVIGPS